MDQNSQKPNHEGREKPSLSDLLRFLAHEPQTQAVANVCEACGASDQFDLESRLCSNCQSLSQENAEGEEFNQDEHSHQDSDIELSEGEVSNDEQQTENIMEKDFDALINNKDEEELIGIASLLSRQFKQKDFEPKAAKLLKRLDGIWTAGTMEFVRKNDGKCVKCKKNKVGGSLGRCRTCYSRIVRWRKKLILKSYSKCAGCKKIKLLYCSGRCGVCYQNYRMEQQIKQKLAEKASKGTSTPIKRQKLSSDPMNGQQSENNQEFERKRKPGEQVQEQTDSPVFKCFGCANVFAQSELSPKDRICMGCFTISLVVKSRPDYFERPI